MSENENTDSGYKHHFEQVDTLLSGLTIPTPEDETISLSERLRRLVEEGKSLDNISEDDLVRIINGATEEMTNKPAANFNTECDALNAVNIAPNTTTPEEKRTASKNLQIEADRLYNLSKDLEVSADEQEALERQLEKGFEKILTPKVPRNHDGIKAISMLFGAAAIMTAGLYASDKDNLPETLQGSAETIQTTLEPYVEKLKKIPSYFLN